MLNHYGSEIALLYMINLEATKLDIFMRIRRVTEARTPWFG